MILRDMRYAENRVMSQGDQEYSQKIIAWLEPTYVAADERGDIFGGSGSSGDMVHWEARRRIIADAFDHDGTWLDVGCANGLLMETLTRWVGEKGHTLEPYGLDLAPRIAERARLRYPQWAERIWTGNVMTFAPPIRFDYVTMLTDAVAPHRCVAMVERVRQLYLKPGARLILSSYGPGGFITPHKAPATDQRPHLEAAGLTVAGYRELIEAETGRIKVRVAWADVRG